MHDLAKAPAHRVETLGDLVAILKPVEHGIHRELAVRGFGVDSRTIQPGEVFVAIAGNRVDGHRFVAEALTRGAVACLVSSLEQVGERERLLQVPDTIAALGYLAAAHRQSLKTKVIGLTGSVGKTTTKDMLHTIMSLAFCARKSAGNFNSTIGLPIQLLKLTPEDEWMIAEMGMSTPGEIRQLMRMARPDMGLWLTVKAVHLANFPHIEAIAAAKAEMVEELAPDRTLVFNADDPLVTPHCLHFPGKRIPYGIYAPRVAIRARFHAYPSWKGTPFELDRQGQKPISIFLPMVGQFNVKNALAASAAALAAGFPEQELANAFKRIQPGKGRSLWLAFENDIQLVDDTYNANPYAVSQVLRCFALLSPRHYRWLILGDMLELGPDETAIHRELGRTLAGYGFDRISLVGALCQHTHAALKRADLGDCVVEHFKDAEEALQKMSVKAPAGARIWIKASRGIHLETLAVSLSRHLEMPPRMCHAL